MEFLSLVFRSATLWAVVPFLYDNTAVSVLQVYFGVVLWVSAFLSEVLMENIIVALITGGITLIGVLIANSKSQAVTDTKLEELTREVREHNNFARRMPVVEEQIKSMNHRITDLERKED